jgi:type II secretory pathway pseudopilin PulG
MAIASLILGILGFCSMGVTGIVGFVLGIIGLVQMNKSQGQLEGRGIAIAGMATSFASFIILPVVAAMLFPVFSKARDKARLSSCLNNQRQIAVSFLIYCQDHDLAFPEASSAWNSISIEPQITHCPAVKPTGISYGFNAYLGGKTIGVVDDPSAVILIADTDNDGGLLQGVEDIDRRHNRVAVAGYIDGHIAYLGEGDAVVLK